MDEWKCIRADRDYRLKFPDDLVSGGENGESLNGQIWFGAECLASGSNILNHETESELLRPMAKLLTNTLEQLRLELRHGINHSTSSASSSSSDRHHSGINNPFRPFVSHGPSHGNASNSTSTINLVCIHPSLKHRLESFDILFAEFEYEYVKAMLPIKTAEEIEKLHEVTALFSESVAYSLKKGLISQDDLEECTPHVLIVIPRLAILYALVHCPGETAILRKLKSSRRDSSGGVCSMFKPYHALLSRVRELTTSLRPVEVDVLERMLTNEDVSLIPPSPTISDGKSPDVILPDSLVLRTGSSATAATTPASTSSVPHDDEEEDEVNPTDNRSSSSSSTSTTVTSHHHHPYHQYSQSYPQKTPSSASCPPYRFHGGHGHLTTCNDSIEHESSSVRPSSSVKERTSSSASFRFRRHKRRHSDPVESVHRQEQEQLMSYKAGCLLKDSSTSSLSLITTLRELKERTGRMSLDPEVLTDNQRTRGREHEETRAITSVAVDPHSTYSSSSTSTNSSTTTSPAPPKVVISGDDDEQDDSDNIDCDKQNIEEHPSTSEKGRLTSVSQPEEDEEDIDMSGRERRQNQGDNREDNGQRRRCGRRKIAGANDDNVPSRLSIISSSSSSSSSPSTDGGASSNSSSSSVDSFELALAAAASKSPHFITPGMRQLLHRLFVTISGVADQLQSNCAADLRVILRHVFKMYTIEENDNQQSLENDARNDEVGDNAGDEDVFVEDGGTGHTNTACSSSSTDEDSVEEALEAREDGGSSSSTSTSSPITGNADEPTSLLGYLSSSSAEEEAGTSCEKEERKKGKSRQGSITSTPRVSFDVPEEEEAERVDPSTSREISQLPPNTSSIVPRRSCLSQNSKRNRPVSKSVSSDQPSTTVQRHGLVRHGVSHPTTTGIEGQTPSPSPTTEQQFPSQPSSNSNVLSPTNPSSSEQQPHGHRGLFVSPSSQPTSTTAQPLPSTVTTPPPTTYGIPQQFRPASRRRRVQSDGGPAETVGHPILTGIPGESSSHGRRPILTYHHDVLSTPASGSVSYTPPPLTLMAPVWVPDELVTSCTSCDQPFTLLRRRHHCRNCGNIYCNQCSSHSIPLSQYGYNKPVRVCDRCFLTFRTIQALQSVADAPLHPSTYIGHQQHVPQTPQNLPPPPNNHATAHHSHHHNNHPSVVLPPPHSHRHHFHSGAHHHHNNYPPYFPPPTSTMSPTTMMSGASGHQPQLTTHHLLVDLDSD